MIRKVILTNYRLFESFTFECNADLNIIVGDNESGKSTILEAINLALTRKLNGRAIDGELSHYLFNKSCTDKYLAAIAAGKNPELPSLSIQVFLSDSPDTEILRGTNNNDGADCCGVKLE